MNFTVLKEIISEAEFLAALANVQRVVLCRHKDRPPKVIPSLSLPEDCRSAFGYGDSQAMVAAVTQDKALFYARKSGEWTRKEDMDFTLPAGARGLWCFSLKRHPP